MKRFADFPTITLMVCLAALLVLAACGRGNDDESPTAEPAAQAQADASTPEPAATEAASEASESAAETPAAPEEAVAESGKVGPPENFSGGPAAELDAPARDGMYDAPPEMTIDPEKYYYATLKTDRGDLKVQLFADRAPITVNNFVHLAREGFYDNTSFHRVLDGFMAQAGDPLGTGTGGPGYEFEDEFYPGLVFDRPGLLAMANRGPATNGSQFFITFAPTDWLNGMHTIFGEVLEGQEVLDQLTRRDPMADPNSPSDTIYTIEIEETDTSALETPTPAPPTATPTPTPTPYAPTSLDDADRPLAQLSPEERANYFNVPPEMVIDPTLQYVATISTDKGEIVAELNSEKAPMAVNNFVVLANLGFYDNMPITLVRPDDSVIFGVPANDPQNDAGYVFAAEVGTDIVTDVGSITYIPVRSTEDGAVLSSSSQVIIALAAPPAAANSSFSFFGQVVEGQEILAGLAQDDLIESVVISTK
ncbi:MAG: hypothetical protein HC802_02860 [Caldilineaceae bacterium]|nr:hypothetical protein [Caldilineaceae bacterium]